MKEDSVIEGNKIKPRKECYTRQTFAYEKGLHWFSKIQHQVRAGNIFSCKATIKWLQARRIYIHYQNEFQKNQLLPLST